MTPENTPIDPRRAAHKAWCERYRKTGAVRALPRYSSVGRVVTARRKALRLSQAELAKRAGISQPHLSKIENSMGFVHTSTLQKLVVPLEADDVLSLIPPHLIPEYESRLSRMGKNPGQITPTYFIVAGDYVKIGHSWDVEMRLRAVTTHCPLPAYLAGVTTIPEKALHERFAAKRVHHEWFQLDEELRQFIADNAGPLV